jgi:NhaA family Na+:H+ antiporter
MSGQPAGKETREERFFYPWERTLDRLVTPFEEFIHRQTTSGMILLATSVVAVVLANSPLRDAYLHLTHAPVAFRIGGAALEMSWLHMVNEGLMVFSFSSSAWRSSGNSGSGSSPSRERPFFPSWLRWAGC